MSDLVFVAGVGMTPAQAKTADTALEADRAKQRVRGLTLDHSRDRALFELEQRARLVA